MAMRILNGREAVDRAGAAEVAQLGLSTIGLLHRHRATNGFPERIPGTTEWYADDIRTWAEEHREAKRAALTPIDRSGDPDELVGQRVAAQILGYSDPQSLRNTPTWARLLAAVDDQEELPSGRVRRRWRRRTVQDVGDQRTGRGGGRPTGAPAGQPDRSGEPDELVDAATAAHVLGYSRAENLPTVVLNAADSVKTGPRGRSRRHWRRSTLWSLADTLHRPAT